MKRAKTGTKTTRKATPMAIIPRETPTRVMDAQDNRRRGDGAARRVMTTFQMDETLKAALKAHCDDTGVKIGAFINAAVREKLDRDA